MRSPQARISGKRLAMCSSDCGSMEAGSALPATGENGEQSDVHIRYR